MWFVFAGGHRMGSTYQFLILRKALVQLKVRVKKFPSNSFDVCHLAGMREAVAQCNATPQFNYLTKIHAAYPAHIKVLLEAKESRIFLVWRDQRDSLVSDYYFSQRRAGHSYTSFNDYFQRRGRRVLYRNCLQKTVWDTVEDPRVRAWDYLDLCHDFETSVREMIAFAGYLEQGLDFAKLADDLSISSLRKSRNDSDGSFFRQGGKQNLQALSPSDKTLAEIKEIEQETDWQVLSHNYEIEDWMRVLMFGYEDRKQGKRKDFQRWLHSPERREQVSNFLSRIYRNSPRRLLGRFK